MKFKLSKLAIWLVSVCAFSGQAMATTFSEGVILSAKTFVVGNVVNGNFTDDWTFTIPSSSFSSIVVSSSLGSVFHIAGFTTSLINTGTSTTISSTGGTIGPMGIGAGSYDLQITGNANGSLGGSYGGVVSISPVPEPTEGALLLSGICLLGFIAARRKYNA